MEEEKGRVPVERARANSNIIKDLPVLAAPPNNKVPPFGNIAGSIQNEFCGNVMDKRSDIFSGSFCSLIHYVPLCFTMDSPYKLIFIYSQGSKLLLVGAFNSALDSGDCAALEPH